MNGAAAGWRVGLAWQLKAEVVEVKVFAYLGAGGALRSGFGR